VEVRGPAAVVLAGEVEQQVPRPAEGELKDEAEEEHERSLLEQAVGLAVLGILSLGGKSDGRTRLGNKHLVACHVTGCLVMHGVRDSPRVIGDEEEGVEDPADRVVDEL